MHVNWGALGEVFLVALVIGVGTIGLFSLGIMALDRREAAVTNGRPVVGATVVSVLCFVACAAIVGYGIYLVIAR
ncbi:hypothetical protein DMH04_37140 [Kibdelosporangium aridum]|uniref:Uncharacterized protein n=1 Tax=Kibdelosporangium aridum TaxID=2030 RepID=A0A428YYZ8_KIBAR|nr:hypothetical protein [Kibdelosporangium aridum]RSM75936.1 hypothetical protein DMH04_37140 [Kibdelosporangium aridum]